MIEYLEDIRQHFEEWYPKEGCGILLASKGKISWHPCNNVAETENDFVIDSNIQSLINTSKKTI